MPHIEKEVILSELKKLQDTFEKKMRQLKSLHDMQDQVIDPLGVLVHCSIELGSKELWLEFEKKRRSDKSLTNAIGIFHENVLASLPEWEHATGGFDVFSHKRRIIAEIKNKHNTLNANVSKTLHRLFTEHRKEHSSDTVYLVTIIPKKGRVNEPWVPTVRGSVQYTADENIRIIDGASFYDLATQEEDSLHQVYKIVSEHAINDGKVFQLIEDLYSDSYGK